MHSTFWDNWDDETKEDWFRTGIGDWGITDRTIPRNFVISKGYKSILDIACGPSVDLVGYRNVGYDIDYTGIDSSEHLLNVGNARVRTILGDAEELPFSDNTFDVSYARHIIEHLPNRYCRLTDEAIRVAKHEFILVLFRPLLEGELDIGEYSSSKDLWHWSYSKSELEKYILANPKVENIEYPEDNHSGIVSPETGKGAYTGYILFVHLKPE